MGKLPQLKFLDSRTVTAEERAEAERVGAFMRVVRPSVGGSDGVDMPSDTAAAKTSSEDDYTPLPPSQGREGRHSGSFGQAKYVYHGRGSEGNRFIRDDVL